jgi:UTP--glucose-1-phosphate uridylyltransferase
MINFAYVGRVNRSGLVTRCWSRGGWSASELSVLVADVVMDAVAPAIKQLIDVFDRVGGPVLAVERVPREDISSYGVIAVEPNPSLGEGIYQVRDLVEKPPKEEAPSDLAIIGRYVLTPDIFPALAATKSDRTGEIQLTNGLRELLKKRPIYACEVKGVRHDTGNKLGFLKASLMFRCDGPISRANSRLSRREPAKALARFRHRRIAPALLDEALADEDAAACWARR